MRKFQAGTKDSCRFYCKTIPIPEENFGILKHFAGAVPTQVHMTSSHELHTLALNP